MRWASCLGPQAQCGGTRRPCRARFRIARYASDTRPRRVIVALELERLNRQRQAIEMRVVDQAARQADVALGVGTPGAGDASWRARAGIRAFWALSPRDSRSASTSRAFVWAMTAKAGLATGSGRSIAGVDLGACGARGARCRHPHQGRRSCHGCRPHHRAARGSGIPRLSRASAWPMAADALRAALAGCRCRAHRRAAPPST